MNLQLVCAGMHNVLPHVPSLEQAQNHDRWYVYDYDKPGLFGAKHDMCMAGTKAKCEEYIARRTASPSILF